MRRKIDVAFHLVDARNWASVQACGLLSASHLMSLSGTADARRAHRPAGVRLPNGALVRDQSPMPPTALVRCLQNGLTPGDWYELLNGKVFFWLDPERLNRQRLACGAHPQIVVVFDIQALLVVYEARASVTPFNTGYAMRRAAPRGASTFVPYRRWVSHGWADEQQLGAKPRPATHRPVEFTVEDAVPDALHYATKIIPLGTGEVLTADRLGDVAPIEALGQARGSPPASRA